jgi:hypothetical protein
MGHQNHAAKRADIVGTDKLQAEFASAESFDDGRNSIHRLQLAGGILHVGMYSPLANVEDDTNLPVQQIADLFSLR